MPRKTVYNLVSLDVWGNARDGYEVNNTYRSGAPDLVVYHAGEDPTEEDVLRALRRGGYITKGTRSASIGIEDCYPDWSITDERRPRIPVNGDPPGYGHGKPVFLLESPEG